MPIATLFVMEGFPKKIRATALGFIYAVTIAAFGGTAQMVVTELLILTDKNQMAPFWYVGFSLIVGIFFTNLIKTHNNSQEES